MVSPPKGRSTGSDFVSSPISDKRRRQPACTALFANATQIYPSPGSLAGCSALQDLGGLLPTLQKKAEPRRQPPHGTLWVAWGEWQI